mgnify:FL=1
MLKTFEVNGVNVHGCDRAAERMNAIGVPLHRADSTCEQLEPGEAEVLYDRDGRFLAHVRRISYRD